MAPTHVTKRQAAAERAAATKKAAAREGTPADEKDTKTKPAEAEQAAPDAAEAEGAAKADQPEQQAADAETVTPSPSVAVQTPAEDGQEDGTKGRASLLQALATGKPAEAASEAAAAPQAPARTVQPTGRRETWTEAEDAVQVLVVADLFKANVDGHMHFGYRGSVLTVPPAVAERGTRFGALAPMTEED